MLMVSSVRSYSKIHEVLDFSRGFRAWLSENLAIWAVRLTKIKWFIELKPKCFQYMTFPGSARLLMALSCNLLGLSLMALGFC